MSKALKKQALWFTIVGALAALTHLLILVAMVNWVELSPAWGNVVAFLFAFIVSFGGHFSWTFSSPDKRTTWLTHLGKWFASSVAGFLANQGLFLLGLHWLGEAYYIPIWFIVTILVTLITFVLGKQWAFKLREKT